LSERSTPVEGVGGASDTKQRLIEAALHTLKVDGIAGTSARTVARRAQVNQALIFYHFGTVGGLLAEASRQASRGRADVYRQRLTGVRTVSELADIARQLHAEERREGNLTALTQLLAGARRHPELVAALRDNFELLAAEVRRTLHRLLDSTPLEGLLPVDDLARSVSAGFLGLELLDTLSETPDAGLFDVMDALSQLADDILELPALPAALLRRRLPRTKPG
jgi:AcrR family transcriptional regulator